jgi:hypothetical protein
MEPSDRKTLAFDKMPPNNRRKVYYGAAGIHEVASVDSCFPKRVKRIPRGGIPGQVIYRHKTHQQKTSGPNFFGPDEVITEPALLDDESQCCCMTQTAAGAGDG